MTELTDRIDALLPQTQCTKCGYEGCRPYAQAIAAGLAPINRCPPGGDEGIAALAALLAVPVLPLDTACGEHGPLLAAVIDEAHCIGCTLCIQACPVDAIVGANKRMHTVLADLCTGCDLCIAPCPVDCIAMVPANRAWTPGDANAARLRHQARDTRLARQAADNSRLMAETPESAAACASDVDSSSSSSSSATHDAERKRSAVESALARARARRAASK